MYDPSGALGATGAATVAAATERVTAHGAFVRVRVYGGRRPVELDKQERLDEEGCLGWRLGTTRMPRLIVCAVSVADKRTALYYGASFEDELDGAWPQIVNTQVGPRFEQGNLAGGLAVGLDAIADALDDGGSVGILSRNSTHGLGFLFGAGRLYLLASFALFLVFAIVVKVGRRGRSYR